MTEMTEAHREEVREMTVAVIAALDGVSEQRRESGKDSVPQLALMVLATLLGEGLAGMFPRDERALHVALGTIVEHYEDCCHTPTEH